MPKKKDSVQLNQFAIRNSQFAITFCDGDLDPDPKRAALQRLGLKPPKFVNVIDLRNDFKLVCTKNKSTMTQVLVNLMNEYIQINKD